MHPDPDPVKTSTGCEAWQPRAEAWSTRAGAQPELLESFSASLDGKYLYAVGRWADAGVAQRRVLRSADWGSTWCLLSASPSAQRVVASRADDATVYVEDAASGGMARLSRSADAGVTWSTVELAFSSAGGLETSLTLPNVIWVRSETSLNVSRDGGDSWSIERPPAWDQPEDGPHFIVDPHFLVDPTSARRIIAAATAYQLDALTPAQPSVYSSDDGGQSWNEIAAPADGVDIARALVDAAGTLYVVDEGDDNRLLRSLDWGKTWNDAGPLPTGLDPDHLTTLGSTTPGLLYVSTPDALWASTDGGSRWSAQRLNSAPEALLSLTGSTLLGREPEGLSISKDGGKSWKLKLWLLAPGTLVQSPLEPGHVWSLSGPTRLSSDGGDTWKAVSDISRSLVFDGADSRVMYDGLGVTRPRRSGDGGLTWAPLNVSDGVTAWAGCGPGASCLYFLNQTWQDSSRTFSCELARSDDGGRTQSEPWEVPLSVCQTGVLAVAPDSPNHLLAGCANAICESHDGGHHFDTHLIDSNQSRFVDHLIFLPSGVALLATRNVTERGLEASAVFERSLDGGSSWLEMKGLSALSYADGFFASYAQPGTAFVVGNISKSVFRSDDDGATWREASPPLSDSASRSYDDPTLLLVWGGIVDHAGGGFLASTNQGLVHFD